MNRQKRPEADRSKGTMRPELRQRRFRGLEAKTERCFTDRTSKGIVNWHNEKMRDGEE